MESRIGRKSPEILKEEWQNSGKSPTILKDGITKRWKTPQGPKRQNDGKSPEILNDGKSPET